MVSRILHGIVVFAVGFFCGGAWFNEHMAPSLYKSGVEKGREFVDWKKLALSEKKVTNQICNAWWFESDHRDRRVKP